MAMTCLNECIASPLLCPEDQTSIFVFDEEKVMDGEDSADHGGIRGKVECRKSGVFDDVFIDFPPQSEECLALLVSIEADYLPRDGYFWKLHTGALELAIRRDAIDWIWKVHAHYKFGPLSAYLSVNYLDRFLSYWECPQGKTWMTQLLSVACLSLAAKMEEAEVPLSFDLQQIGEAKYLFESKTIQRMELLMLTTLKWKMRSVTPFSFIDYFLHRFNSGVPPGKELLCQSVDLILSTIRHIDLLEFRPSEIAASVALFLVGEKHQLGMEEALSSCIHIDKLRTLRCYEVVKSVALIRRPPKSADGSMVTSSTSQTPAGVLDAASCLSCKSDDTTVESGRVFHEASSDSKRRKIERTPTS